MFIVIVILVLLFNFIGNEQIKELIIKKINKIKIFKLKLEKEF